MAEPLKYIVVKENGCELPIIFPAILNHCTIAGAQNVVSAGKCRVVTGSDGEPEVECWGESITISGVCSRPNDSALLTRELRRPLDIWG